MYCIVIFSVSFISYVNEEESLLIMAVVVVVVVVISLSQSSFGNHLEFCLKLFIHGFDLELPHAKCIIQRLRDKLVGNYYSDGTMEKLAGCHGSFRG